MSENMKKPKILRSAVESLRKQYRHLKLGSTLPVSSNADGTPAVLATDIYPQGDTHNEFTLFYNIRSKHVHAKDWLSSEITKYKEKDGSWIYVEVDDMRFRDYLK